MAGPVPAEGAGRVAGPVVAAAEAARPDLYRAAAEVRRLRVGFGGPAPDQRQAECFHRTLLEEWAYIQFWTQKQQRNEARQHPLQQSPPAPRNTRMGHTHRNPTSTHRGQPTRAAQLGKAWLFTVTVMPWGGANSLRRVSCTSPLTSTRTSDILVLLSRLV